MGHRGTGYCVITDSETRLDQEREVDDVSLKTPCVITDSETRLDQEREVDDVSLKTPWDRSHVKAFTRVVSLFSIVMRGEFGRRSVKKTDWGRGLLGCVGIRCGVVTNVSLRGVTVKRAT